MKGLSPFVASIMLIAFTVAAGAIISLWFTSFSQKTTAGVGEQTTAVTKCAGALKITYVSNGTAIIEPSVSGVTIYLSSVVDSAGEVLNETPMEITSAKTITLKNITKDVEWIKASGSCEYQEQNVSIEAVCYRGQDCWAV